MEKIYIIKNIKTGFYLAHIAYTENLQYARIFGSIANAQKAISENETILKATREIKLSEV